jgi:hypothetical protein
MSGDNFARRYSVVTEARRRWPVSPPAAASETPDAQRIEIALGNGRVVRVGAGVDVDSLRRILDAADGR